MTNEAEPRPTPSDDAVTPSAPSWMDEVPRSVAHRRGAKPASRSGLHTAVFLAVIGLSVAAAGIAAVSMWGPDISPKNRTPVVETAAASSVTPLSAEPSSLPSAVTESTPSPEAAPAAEEEAPPPPAKKGKKGVRPPAKRAH